MLARGRRAFRSCMLMWVLNLPRVQPANPFADPLRFERRVPECAIIIFGASGDLSKRKLLPALYRLAYERRLPSTFSIIGTSRSPLSDDAFREKMRHEVKQYLEKRTLD